MQCLEMCVYQVQGVHGLCTVCAIAAATRADVLASPAAALLVVPSSLQRSAYKQEASDAQYTDTVQNRNATHDTHAMRLMMQMQRANAHNVIGNRHRA